MPEPLTIDAAVGILEAAAPPEPPEEAPAAAEAPEAEIAEALEGATTESEAAPEAEDQTAPEEASGEEEAEPEAPASLPASDGPRSWDADAREEFAKLPRAIQDIVLARADQDSRAVAKAIQEANEARQAAATDVAKVETLAKQLSEFLPEAMKTFESKWGQAPDWNAVIEQYGAEEAFKLKFQYDREREQLGEIARRENEAKSLAHQTFVKDELAKLDTVDPALAGQTGAALRTEVAQHALQAGWVTQAELPHVSAAQLSMARKAMLYDRLPDAIKSGKLPDPTNPNPAPKPAAAKTPARPAVRPTAAAPAPSATRAAQDAATRFGKSRSIDDAVALLETRRR